MPKQTFFNLPDEKRNRLIERALDEFSRHGYKEASITRLVAAAEIAKGSFYQYFEDKDDLYVYIVETMLGNRKLAVFERERERLAQMKLTDFLRLVFLMQMDEFGGDQRLARISLDFARITDTQVHDRIMKRYGDRLETFFLSFIRHAQEHGEIDPKVNALMLNFMLLSLGEYTKYLYTGGKLNIDEFPKTGGTLIDRLMNDFEYILSHGIYSKEE